jgi:Zn-dependent protease
MELIFIIAVLIFSVIIHEVAHGLMADQLGDPTARYAGRLTLNPLPHLDPIGSVLLPLISFYAGGFIFGWAKPVPYNPYNLRNPRRDSLLVALAGPLSNIVLAGLFLLLFHLAPVTMMDFKNILAYPIRVNLVLALFNLIPIPPLDGSKIFLSWLPIERQIYLEQYGFILVILFLFLFGGLFFRLVSLISSLLGI